MTRKNKPVGEDDLTAYVDGELPDERRAFVEQWLTQHPAEQRQILADQKVRHRLKSTLDPLADTSLPSRFRMQQIRQDRNRRHMEVIAPDPQISAAFSTNLISYAEDRVNNLSHQKRGDQMQDAMQGFENAQKERRKAQESLVQLQQKGAILDPEGVIAGLRSQINNIEIQLQEKQLQLAALLDNTRPNQAKVDGARGDIGRLQDLLDRLNARMLTIC